MEPILTMSAGGTRWLAPIFAGLAAVLFVTAAVTLIVLDDGGLSAVAIVAGTVGTIAVLLLVIPRRYEIWRDHLRIVFVWGTWHIAFDTITSVAPALSRQSYAFWGVRFSTSPGQAIVVHRRNPRLIGRLEVVISPESRDIFLPALQQALTRFRALPG